MLILGLKELKCSWLIPNILATDRHFSLKWGGGVLSEHCNTQAPWEVLRGMSPSFHSENVEASKRCINALKNSAQDILLEIKGKIPLSVAVFLLCVFFRHFSFKEVVLVIT